MNILLINHYAGSKTHGMEYRPYYLAKEWVKLGHKVKIVGASYSHLRINQPIVNEVVTTEYIDGIDYVWVKAPRYSGNGAKRFLNILSFVTKLFVFKKKIMGAFIPDAIIASSTYPLDIYPAKYYAKSFGSQLIFEVHDLWPLSLMELAGMSKWNPFIMLMQKAEDDAYRYSDKVVSLLPKAIEHMTERGMDPKKFNYVPNGICSEEWKATESGLSKNRELDFIEKIKTKGFFVIGYAGFHGLANALEYVIEAMSMLKDKPIYLILVGDGPDKQKLKELSNRKGVGNVAFIDPVRKKDIPSVLRSFDMLFIGWRKNALYKFGICPNKLMDYMMAGKPVLHSVEAGNDVVQESGCGISVKPEDPGMIAHAIVKMFNISPEERKLMGGRGHDYVMANNIYSILSEKFLDILKK